MPPTNHLCFIPACQNTFHLRHSSGVLGTGQGGRSQTPRQTRLPFKNLERESEDVDELQPHSADIRVRRLGHVVTLAAPISVVETPAHRRSERGGVSTNCVPSFSPRKLKEEESNRPRQRETSPKDVVLTTVDTSQLFHDAESNTRSSKLTVQSMYPQSE